MDLLISHPNIVLASMALRCRSFADKFTINKNDNKCFQYAATIALNHNLTKKINIKNLLKKAK